MGREEKGQAFPSLPTLPWKARKKTRASHIPTASATAWDFLFSPSSFNFNFDESVTNMPGTFCYQHARPLNKARVFSGTFSVVMI